MAEDYHFLRLGVQLFLGHLALLYARSAIRWPSESLAFRCQRSRIRTSDQLCHSLVRSQGHRLSWTRTQLRGSASDAVCCPSFFWTSVQVYHSHETNGQNLVTDQLSSDSPSCCSVSHGRWGDHYKVVLFSCFAAFI